MRVPIKRRRPKVDRLVWNSSKNVAVTGVPDRVRRYLSDFYTTLIDIEWRWNLLFFTVGVVLGWLGFACLYYFMMVVHGDLEPRNLNNTDWTPCLVGVSTFTGAFLFSIETMSAIGYGTRYETEECPGVYILVMIQLVVGTGVQFALASLVVSKMRRAKSHSQTILFSNTAVIFWEDGHRKLGVRVADLRKDVVIGAHATAMLIKKTTARQGHKVPVRMFTVSLEGEGSHQNLFLYWPSLLIHVVDENSPFWSLSRDQLLLGQYELLVVLSGVSATTSKLFQARKSYYSWEIMWGQKFHRLEVRHNDSKTDGYVVDFTHFHDMTPTCMPSCSAQELQNRELFGAPDLEDEDVDSKDNDDGDDGGDEGGDDDNDDVFMPAETCEDDVGPASTSPLSAANLLWAMEKEEEKDSPTVSKRAEYLPRRSPWKHGKFQRPLSFGDALNLYRHRRSVTDTYLGTDISDEDSDDSEENEALMSIVSQQSRQEVKPDVRDILWAPPRRTSFTMELMFGPESSESDDEAQA